MSRISEAEVRAEVREWLAANWDPDMSLVEWRRRLACAWPLMIGLATLGELAAHPNPLSVKTPIKISRSAVRALLAQSAVTVWSNRALAAHGAKEEQKNERSPDGAVQHLRPAIGSDEAAESEGERRDHGRGVSPF